MINNADRKSGHCLIGPEGRLWAIDHGICFHVEFKMRTVIWEFSAEPIEPDTLEDLARFRAPFATHPAQSLAPCTACSPLTNAPHAGLRETLVQQTLSGCTRTGATIRGRPSKP